MTLASPCYPVSGASSLGSYISRLAMAVAWLSGDTCTDSHRTLLDWSKRQRLWLSRGTHVCIAMI